MTSSLTAAQVRRARWESLGLGASRCASAVDVVSRLGALQGQDLPGLLHSCALRVPGATAETVTTAFQDGSLVRGWPMRGTLHAIHADELAPLTALTQRRVLGGMASRARNLGLTDSAIDAVLVGVTSELAARDGVTRTELRALISHFLSGEPQPGAVAHLAYQLGVRGLICHGPFRDGAQLIVTARNDSRGGADDDDFLPRILERYVGGHGPVSDADAARWFGLPVTMIREARAVLADAVIDVETPTGLQWMRAGAETDSILSNLGKRPRTRLLPGFDEFMLGYVDRSFAVPAASLSEIVPGNNGMFRATVVSGASVIGTWTKKNTRGDVRVRPFTALSAAARRSLDAAGNELGRIVGTQVSVHIDN